MRKRNLYFHLARTLKQAPQSATAFLDLVEKRWGDMAGNQ